MEKRDSLVFALDFEHKGIRLYAGMAVKTNNLLAQEVFYSLAKQEIDHARRIGQISIKLKKDRGWEPMVPDRLPDLEGEIKRFFETAGKTGLKGKNINIKGYETAMKMERKGYKAYQNFHAGASDAGEKEFFMTMMQEENKHYETLANVYAYLTNSDDWMRVEESRTWNWMNI